MLTQISVQNFAIIDDITLEFNKGLNIVTGETGSGKSLLIKSLSLLMGEKGSPEMIKHQCQFARVEGIFDISDRADIQKKLIQLGLTNETLDDLIVRRLIQSDKNKVFINDHLVTLQTLRYIVFPLIDLTSRSAPLIEITGQFDNKNLLNKSFHMEMIDLFIGHFEVLDSYKKQFEEYLKLREDITLKTSKIADLEKTLDYLIFQKNEIETLDLKPNEDIEIENQIKILKNESKLNHFVDLAQNSFSEDSDSITSQLKSLLKKQSELTPISEEMNQWFLSLKQIITLIEDLSYQLNRMGNHFNESEDTLEKLSSRLSQIRKLQKKYGPQISDILIHLEKMNLQIYEIQNFDEQIEKLKKQEKSLHSSLKKLGDSLHKNRQKASLDLSQLINNELKDLNMKGVSFVIQVNELDDLGPTGLSDIEFKAQNNSQGVASSLSKVASGGELSRILLALKVVVGKEEWPRTYLFDEVDTGVSGLTAEKVGRKLSDVAKSQQVICVTHLPQVAVFGHQHYLLEKDPSKKNQVQAFKLNPSERTKEIARLISGEKITQSSLKHAKELINQSHQI